MLENLLVFSTGLIGLLAIIQILVRLKLNRITNIYLILIFSIIVARFLVFGFFSLFDGDYLEYILTNCNNLLIVIIPLTYLYFTNLVHNRMKILASDAYHFIVPLLFVIIDFLDDFQVIIIPFKNLFFLSFFLIFIVFYIVSNYLILHKNIWSKTSSISFINRQNKIIKNWTIFLFSLLLLMGFRFMVSLVLEVTSDHYNYGNSFMWISSSIWLFIFFRILIFPEILNGYSYHTVEMPSKEKPIMVPSFWKNEIGYKITNVQDLQLEKKIADLLIGYIAAIDNIKISSKLFRDSSINLSDLAYRLNIPKSHLTFLFKYYSKVSFSEYKKTVRIEDALELIDQGYLKNNTFDSLAREVGFASYNPFFTSFKEIVGLTPQEYFNSYEHYNKGAHSPIVTLAINS